MRNGLGFVTVSLSPREAVKVAGKPGRLAHDLHKAETPLPLELLFLLNVQIYFCV